MGEHQCGIAGGHEMLLLWICSECRIHFGEEHTFSRRNGRMKDDSQHFGQRKNGVASNM